MRLYIDLEAGPPPMTHGEKLALLTDKTRPKEPEEPTLKPVAGNITKEATIAAHEKRNWDAYQVALEGHTEARKQWALDVMEAAEEAWRRLAVDPLRAVINTIGWADDSGFIYQHSGEDIAAVLTAFAESLPPFVESFEWVSANGNGYDFPLLHVSICRMIRAKAPGEWRRLRDAIPWTLDQGASRRSIDIMGRGAAKRGRNFGAICEAYIGEGKQGSEDPVGDWLDPERRHLLLERNARDVELLMMLDEVLR